MAQSELTDDEKLDRIVEEIIDAVDVYLEGEGPEGSWHFHSLEIKRVMNDVMVFGDDTREIHAVAHIDAFAKEDNPRESLKEWLVNLDSL